MRGPGTVEDSQDPSLGAAGPLVQILESLALVSPPLGRRHGPKGWLAGDLNRKWR